MRVPLRATVLVVLLAGCSAVVPGAEVDEAGFSAVQFGGSTFIEQDIGRVGDVRLHAETHLPASPLHAGAPTRFPAVLVLSPYWADGTGGGPTGFPPYDMLVRRLVPRGYAVVFGDLAGSGGSSGCWDFMGPVERAGAVGMVEAIAAQPWSDGHVGMVGLSYDAMAALMAASDDAPHLDAVVLAAPLTHAYAGLMQNGVRYGGPWRLTTFGYEQRSLAPTANLERLPGYTERAASSPPCVAENLMADVPTDAYSEYFRARDLRPMGASVSSPVLYLQGLRDGAVRPDQFAPWFDAVPVEKKAWLGDWGHAFPNSAAAGRDDVYLTIHRWLDRWLLGIDNGIERTPRYDVQDTDGGWRHEERWPAADVETLVLRLAPQRGSSFGPASGALVLSGIAFDESTRLSGVPTVRLTLSSDRPAGQVIVRVYEGDLLVTQGAHDLLYAGGLHEPVVLQPGSPVTLDFSLYPVERVLAPGASLRVELSTSDPLASYENDGTAATLTLLGEAEVSLPVLARSEDDVFLVSCGLPVRPPTPPCWRGLPDLGTS